MDYFTKWVEALFARNSTDLVVIKFLEENIIARFGCPAKIITDNAQDFKSARFMKFCQHYNISLGHSTAYYPQGNGLAESSNKTLVRILKKTINENQKNWDSQLKFTLWANRITTKRSTGMSPYELVYGKATVFPIQLALLVARFLQESKEEPDDLIRRMNQLVELNETREQLSLILAEYQEKMRGLFDQIAKEKEIQAGDLVL